MHVEKMHFTGPVWRPPYEANSVLLQVTIGCSHDDCKFCSLYDGVKFKTSPFDEIEEDLKIARQYQPHARRVFLVGANPFVLSYNKLVRLALLIHNYLPEVKNIGGFARITDIMPKSVEQLKDLHRLGFDRITIGTETGDDITLKQMRKGYTAQDIVEQTRKLEEAGIEYHISYLTGLAGKGNGQRNALASAEVFSQLRPYILNVVSLTIFPESDLHQEIEDGLYIETPERERLEELKTLVTHLMPDSKMTILANTVSNPVPLTGLLPYDRGYLLNELQLVLENVQERELNKYRRSIQSL